MRCARCLTNAAEANGICDAYYRRLGCSGNQHRVPRHYPADYDLSPWQENAIRILEDLE
jgi:hypothetical protein